MISVQVPESVRDGNEEKRRGLEADVVRLQEALAFWSLQQKSSC